MKISLRVQPSAARNEVVDFSGGVLKVKVAAPPAKGKANTELLAFLGQVLGVARGSLGIVTGHTSRHKVIAIEGLSQDELSRRLTSASSSSGGARCVYRTGGCLPYEACLVSMASSEGDNTTNAHVASCGHYETQVCCIVGGAPRKGNLTIKLTVPNNNNKVYIPGIGETGATQRTGTWGGLDDYFIASYLDDTLFC